MRFKSKEELLASIEREHGAFVALVATLPDGCYDEPGVWGDDWTVKDLLAHLSAWEQMFLGWYREGLSGKQPDLPAPGYKWNETPRLNKEIWRRHRDKPWMQVRHDFDASYREILELAQSLSENQLLNPGRFAWTGKNPLTTYLGANTVSHYRTATSILKRWTGQQRAGSSG